MLQRKVPALCLPGPLKEEAVLKQGLSVDSLNTILTSLDVSAIVYYILKRKNCILILKG
jgi:hypothetical protein